MGDSGSFSSLLDLAESHLSKTKLDGIVTTTISTNDNLPQLQHRFIIPALTDNSNSNTSIRDFLAEQTANTFKARAIKKQKELEEKEKEQKEKEQRELEDKIKKLNIEEDSNYMIDLTEALSDALLNPRKKIATNTPLNTSQSICGNINRDYFTPKPQLLSTADESGIMNIKMKRKRLSPFGKVLCSRLKPRRRPYKPSYYATDIKSFDFSTPSPDDIAIKEAANKKPVYYDICEIFGLEKSESLQAMSNKRK